MHSLQTYSANVDVVKAELGTAVSQPAIEEALKAKKYKVLTFTHVDTSTGVLSNAKAIAETVKRVSPDTLVVADCVCSVGSEEIRFDDWGLDVVLTASQKGLGTPPGLSIVITSQRAIKVFENRKTPVTSYYASWRKWLPIMKAYEAGNAAYFATPPVNLINAYHASLLQILRASPSLEERFQLHREASKRVKDAATELGLKQIALDPTYAANGMTTVRSSPRSPVEDNELKDMKLYYPEGLGATDVLPRFAQRGLVIAGGLFASIKDKYFRIGHMGVTVVESDRGDVDNIIRVLRESIAEAKSQKA
ncbi:hypothetical protein H0H81_006592 [Sphagnurus paluster]|uniref:Aminotransferase class V domain-containing protein n=1 Tax=Sphagnurus paluster TaxID=117069 RepID=A0A9P7K5F6_9AGAR|nr:hypothetical protein H0H81_006592 [Sphagnurus paluster]